MRFDPRFFGARRITPLAQSAASECGLVCIAMIAATFGHRISLTRLRQQHPVGLRGANLRDLVQVANTLQLVARSLRLDIEEIRQLRLPCILHWDLDHFVVLERVKAKSLRIVDPATGRRRVSMREAGARFTGVALELTAARQFHPRREQRDLRWRDLVAGSPGLYRSLMILLAVSLALQVLLLALPFYGQLVIDEVVVRSDRELLLLLGLSFLVLVSLQAALSMCRSWIVAVTSTRLGIDWSARVYRHLLRLPLDYFECRKVGDVQSRFGSVASLQQLITHHVVESVVDGLMAFTTFFVMLAYDTRLAFVVLLSVVVYCVFRAAIFLPMQHAARQSLVSSADREAYFLETLRGMLTIKAADIGTRRESAFMQRLVAASHDQLRLGSWSIWQLGISRILFSIQLVIVTWVGAAAVLAQSMSVGMLVAFLAYRAMFSERAAALVDKIFEFRLAKVHLERVADIVMTDIETQGGQSAMPQRQAAPLALGVSNLHFCYAPNAPHVLRDLTFDIAAGEHVALTGPSGAGKTTLVKLLMGLLQPSSGTVRINGMPLARYGLQNFRRHLAAVMQDDHLFSGSLLDNVTLFDPCPDLDHCKECLRIADMDAVVAGLPMQLYTLVGDMGAALSGGQKQRLLLARALYRRPAILFLDEFTSHLDIVSEQTVSRRLRALPLTRVVVAHRNETIEQADREIRVAATMPTRGIMVDA